MAGCGCSIEAENNAQKKVLIILLSINLSFFFIEFIAGWISHSTGLMADSLDMLADASVYAVGLYAVGRAATVKIKAAFLNGGLQVLLGGVVLLDIIRRLLLGNEPESLFMLTVGFLALLANVVCLLLLMKHRQGDINMRATWICSRNDVIANLGVIIAGGLVAYTGSATPDFIIGLIIAFIVTKGGIQILNEARHAQIPLPS